MDIRLDVHNAHLTAPAAFPLHDPHLRRLRDQPLVHRSGLLDRLPRDQPGIYTIGGGRQIGKTTLLKQWMVELLDSGVDPGRIRFLTGELIDDHPTLSRLLGELLAQIPAGPLNYVLLDEVTYIRDWDRAVKYVADAGLLERTVLVLTGSDLLVIQEARMRLPGRRGESDVVDFHLHPLSFGEALRLKRALPAEVLDALERDGEVPSAPAEQVLHAEFGAYMCHGGFLTAMNDMARYGRVLPATLSIYSDWIRGDMLKRGKQEPYLREVITAIIRRYGTQLTWNALARELSIDHPATVADYVALLASMDAVLVQPALLEHKLTAAPKKARKISFKDPFIYHALNAWLHAVGDPYAEQIMPLCQEPDRLAPLVEACAAAHYSRRYPTYYIKGQGEVDIAYVAGGRFWPVEVKWTQQLRPKAMKQIARYDNGRILAASPSPGEISGVRSEYLPLALLRLESGDLPFSSS